MAVSLLSGVWLVQPQSAVIWLVGQRIGTSCSCCHADTFKTLPFYPAVQEYEKRLCTKDQETASATAKLETVQGQLDIMKRALSAMQTQVWCHVMKHDECCA